MSGQHPTLPLLPVYHPLPLTLLIVRAWRRIPQSAGYTGRRDKACVPLNIAACEQSNGRPLS